MKVQKLAPLPHSERITLPAPWRSLLGERLPALLLASRVGDEHRAIIAVRRLLAGVRELDKDLATTLEAELSSNELAVASVRDGHALMASTPISHEGNLPLLRRTDLAAEEMPILDATTFSAVASFLEEHRAAERLFLANISPRYTVFLDGPPGVGKTALSKSIAAALKVPHYQLELTSLMSSLLGKTGQQLRDVLDFARANHMVLLLDEFDAIAKRRDDGNDLGELKRIVSVLLKELEEWTGPSVIITATNYATLIDPAIIRRFQLRLSIPMPDESQVRSILARYLQGFPDLPSSLLQFAAKLLQGSSGSEIRLFTQQVLRARCLRPTDDHVDAFISLLAARAASKNDRREFCRLAQELLPRQHGSYARIARLLNVSKGTVHNYMKRASSHG
jgi:MoxR-like ATPase